ncbi:MAG: transposase [candidate division NC10 bacterium]|nr:transposase [candidate division NC10 bacterium]
MSRPLRIEYPGAYYHVMNRGLAHGKVFLDDADRGRFLGLMGEICRLWGLKVYAYCLMDNHYHILLQTPQGGLSRTMRHLDGIYTQKFNRAHQRDGPLFRGRYRAILIDAEEYFLAVARYIHQNPIEAGVVADVDRYHSSSHRGYLDKKSCPIWLDTTAVLSRFGQGRSGLKAYQRFMHAGIEEELRSFYREKYLRPILGDKGFVQWVKEQMGKKAIVGDEIPEFRRVFSFGLEEILEATARVYGKRVDELLRRRRGRENEARAMAMYLCRTLGGHKLVDIGKLVGLEKYSSVSSACLSMKERVAREKRLARRAGQVENLLIKSQKQI